MELLTTLAASFGWLANPAFAVPWFVVGIGGAAWVLYDAVSANSALNPPLKACWPITAYTLPFWSLGAPGLLAGSHLSHEFLARRHWMEARSGS